MSESSSSQHADLPAARMGPLPVTVPSRDLVRLGVLMDAFAQAMVEKGNAVTAKMYRNRLRLFL
jgi:hypothetical protein